MIKAFLLNLTPFVDDGVTKDFDCAYPIVGRYVYVQMVGIQGSLTLCEVMVFTTQGNHSLSNLKFTFLLQWLRGFVFHLNNNVIIV